MLLLDFYILENMWSLGYRTTILTSISKVSLRKRWLTVINTGWFSCSNQKDMYPLTKDLICRPLTTFLWLSFRVRWGLLAKMKNVMSWVVLKGMRIWNGSWLGKWSRGVILSILLLIAYIWEVPRSLSVLSNNRMFFMFIPTVTPTLWSTRFYWTVYLVISFRNKSLSW